MPQSKKDSIKTLDLPASLTKLKRICINTNCALGVQYDPGKYRVRPTRASLELLRVALAAVYELFWLVNDLRQTFSAVLAPLEPIAPVDSNEPQTPTVEQKPSPTWPEFLTLLICPYCRAVVLAKDQTSPGTRRKVERKAKQLQIQCTRSLARVRLHHDVAARLQATDPAKLEPEIADLLFETRQALANLVIKLGEWYIALLGYIDTAVLLDRDRSGLPAFVIGVGVEGTVDVQHGEPCRHLVGIFISSWDGVRPNSYEMRWHLPIAPTITVRDVMEQLPQRHVNHNAGKPNNDYAGQRGFSVLGYAAFAAEDQALSIRLGMTRKPTEPAITT